MADSSNLLLPDTYRASRETVFKSEDSFRWFCRQNRPELVKAGALVRPTGRWLVDPTAFDCVMLAVGMRRAGVACDLQPESKA